MRTQTAPREATGPLATSKDIAAAASMARAHGRIGIDTEFMSEGRYRALLCLVQIAVDGDANEGDESRIDLIDPLQSGVDATPVAHASGCPEYVRPPAK